MSFSPTVLLVIPTILALTGGQVLLKFGVNRLGGLMEGNASLPSEVARVLSSPFVLGGLGLYGVASFLWIYLLSKFSFNYIYPFVSATFVFALLASWLFLGETVPVQRWVAIALITVGIIIGARV
ncbi:MAG: EamA family transporter [Chloroflexi bacterium]|nr:EamA family transporter [Chloroflexota bacterium]